MGQGIIISGFVDIYLDMLAIALPIAVFFGLSNLVVNIFLKAAFTGKLDITGRGSYM